MSNTLSHGLTPAQQYAGLRGKPRSNIPTPPESAIVFIVGHPGSGKTYLAESAPDNYILNFNRSSSVNPSSKALQFPQSMDRTPCGWSEMEAESELLQKLAVENKPRPKMVTIDDLTSMYQMVKDWIPPNAKKIALRSRDKPDTENWNDLDGTASYNWLNQRIVRFITELNQVGYGVLVLAHLREPDLDRQRPHPTVACSPGLWESLRGIPEFTGLLEYRDEVITTSVESEFDAGGGRKQKITKDVHAKVRKYSIVVLREHHYFLKARLPNLKTPTFDLGNGGTPWDAFRKQYMDSF